MKKKLRTTSILDMTNAKNARNTKRVLVQVRVKYLKMFMEIHYL